MCIEQGSFKLNNVNLSFKKGKSNIADAIENTLDVVWLFAIMTAVAIEEYSKIDWIVMLIVLCVSIILMLIAYTRVLLERFISSIWILSFWQTIKEFWLGLTSLIRPIFIAPFMLIAYTRVLLERKLIENGEIYRGRINNFNWVIHIKNIS